MRADLKELAEIAVADFGQTVLLAKQLVETKSIKIEILSAPHKPPSRLPSGFIAVYSFFYIDGHCLKVGKAGPNSEPRYTYQHYSPNSTGSTLARSLVSSPTWSNKYAISAEQVGNWIRTNTSRINFLLPFEMGSAVQNLLEAFLQCRWSPEFEGRST